MKKKEVRWISKDWTGCKVWRNKPILKRGWWDGKGHIGNPCEGYLQYYANIKLKRGGLAKVTIERQY